MQQTLHQMDEESGIRETKGDGSANEYPGQDALQATEPVIESSIHILPRSIAHSKWFDNPVLPAQPEGSSSSAGRFFQILAELDHGCWTYLMTSRTSDQNVKHI
jgi:hypothetical protein